MREFVKPQSTFIYSQFNWWVIFAKAPINNADLLSGLRYLYILKEFGYQQHFPFNVFLIVALVAHEGQLTIV